MIQSSTSDIASLATIRLHNIFKDTPNGMIISLHDGLYFEVEERNWEESAAIIKQEMERPVPEMNDFVVPVSLSVGRFWEDHALLESV